MMRGLFCNQTISQKSHTVSNKGPWDPKISFKACHNLHPNQLIIKHWDVQVESTLPMDYMNASKFFFNVNVTHAALVDAQI